MVGAHVVSFKKNCFYQDFFKISKSSCEFNTFFNKIFHGSQMQESLRNSKITHNESNKKLATCKKIIAKMTN